MTRVVGQTPESQLIEQRLQKLDAIRDLGIEPYPYRFEPTHYSVDIVASFDALNASGEEVRVCRSIDCNARSWEKAAFADLRDAVGRLQIYVRLDNVGDDAFALWKLLDIGDFIGVSGPVFKTRTGQISVQVQTLALLTKAIRPLPVPKEEIRGGERVVHESI